MLQDKKKRSNVHVMQLLRKIKYFCEITNAVGESLAEQYTSKK